MPPFCPSNRNTASRGSVAQLGPAFQKTVNLEFRDATLRQVFEALARSSKAPVASAPAAAAPDTPPAPESAPAATERPARDTSAGLRFNFRGVGRSEGAYDEGRGELADLLSVIEAQAPSGPLCLAGFSFGAFVTSHAASQLQAQREIRRLVLVGTAASRFEVAPVPAELHPRTLVIHGEQDDTVPLASVMAWARARCRRLDDPALPSTPCPARGWC